MVRNWLITGGCGFIGTSLIPRILESQPSAHIRILDNLSVGSKDDLKNVCKFREVKKNALTNESGVFLINGDIRDYDTCVSASENIEGIVHLAANTGVGPSVEDPRQDMENNVIGIFNILESARINSVKKFVFASSGAPAGIVIPPIHEEMAPHPVSPYGASKLAGEGYCSAYYHSYGISTVSLRFGNVYGPRSKHKSSIVAKFVRQALNGETCEVYGDGNQTRDFIYIDDLTDAIMKASEFNGGGETFQIASGVELTLNELIEILKSVFKKETGKELNVKYTEMRLGDVMRNYSDTSKAKKFLNWTVETKIVDGLKLTIRDLFLSHKKVN